LLAAPGAADEAEVAVFDIEELHIRESKYDYSFSTDSS
jgi:hypothetical protein